MSLETFRVKIAHGNGHLQALDESIERWKRRDPYAVIHEKDLQAGKYEILLRVYEPPLVRQWGLMLGDCAHAYRSALDHIVWELATLNVGPGNEPRRQTEFPVFVDCSEYRSKATQKVADLSVPARAEIERLQPYYETRVPYESHPLWVVHELDRVDKHRTLNVTALMNQDFGIGFDSTPIDIELRAGLEMEEPGPLEDGAKIAWADFIAIGPNPQMDVYSKIAFDIAFGDEGSWRGRAVVPVLRDIRNHIVTAVAPALEALV
jgi:hypothetical protein